MRKRHKKTRARQVEGLNNLIEVMGKVRDLLPTTAEHMQALSRIFSKLRDRKP